MVNLSVRIRLISIRIYSSNCIIISLTGFVLHFNIGHPVTFHFSGKNPAGLQQVFEAKSAYSKNIQPMPLKQIIEKVTVQMPGAWVGGVALPDGKFGTYRFDMVSGNLPKEGKREMLTIDQYTGKILLNSRKDFPNVGNAYLSWLTPIHYGSLAAGQPRSSH